MNETFETKERQPGVESEVSPEQYEQVVRSLEKSDSSWTELVNLVNQ